MSLEFRLARPDDLPRLHDVRRAAFAPVFASFRALLGDELYTRAQKPSDDAQGSLLESFLTSAPRWELWVAEAGGVIVGFVAVQLDDDSRIGELGLNAIDPTYAGRGYGTEMYEHALARMRARGMELATVSTGGDDSHAPARRAYHKAGFDAEIPSVWMVRKL